MRKITVLLCLCFSLLSADAQKINPATGKQWTMDEIAIDIGKNPVLVKTPRIITCVDRNDMTSTGSLPAAPVTPAQMEIRIARLEKQYLTAPYPVLASSQHTHTLNSFSMNLSVDGSRQAPVQTFSVVTVGRY